MQTIQHPPEHEKFVDGAGEDLVAKQQAPLEEMPAGTFTSSNVHSGLYDFGERELYMRYKRTAEPDAIYRYDDVPAREWDGLKNAASKGSYINANVAYEYRYVRINSFPDEGRSAQDQRVRRFVTTPMF